MRKLFSLKLYKFILIKFKGYGEKMMNINKKPLFNENGDIEVSKKISKNRKVV